MDKVFLVQEAGLTLGESKVYLALLKLGLSTTGSIVKESGVARSFIYNILEKLVEKGLVSYVVRKKTRFYQASDPSRILDYMKRRRHELEKSELEIAKLLPSLRALNQVLPLTDIQIYEGFKGVQTAFEHYHGKCNKGDETLALGIYPMQEEKYHKYWQMDHRKRARAGIINKLLFNRGTNPKILANRNSFKGCDARYMPSDIQTPAWFFIYADTVTIFLQSPKDLAIEIVNKPIAESFKAYFEDYWQRSKKFKK